MNTNMLEIKLLTHVGFFPFSNVFYLPAIFGSLEFVVGAHKLQVWSSFEGHCCCTSSISHRTFIYHGTVEQIYKEMRFRSIKI